ncbi:glycosyltransferase family 2 protein [Terrimonas sp. NA20]|uniref:Glycosyltransferase family 2 protein n=1 Tax=Terrimonas ginsenosidimutans TaxID=2908004 RepID=A0ABS9L059_9BACT|nr:glycosyltransferase family A protein [Terrimonas ginsenosidimutans]MCG2617958.1 glycosyltransferase family 2 protein [Terrimonas ginsenosidimutans]
MAITSSLSVTPSPAELRFSVCSIVTNTQEFEEMKISFEQCGFEKGCEYIIADNTKGNQFDAYTAINRFIREAKGEYIIIVHQDVRCIDRADSLSQILNDLSAKDPKWAVCGNAGAAGYHRDVRYIVNAGKTITHENLPMRVFSLDENLLIIRRSANIVVSSNLSGFHMYAADLCLLADHLGYNCYVIPFMAEHLSLGNLKDLALHKKNFLDQYGYKMRSRFIQTPSTKFVLCKSPRSNRLSNGPFFFLVKWIEGIKLFFGRTNHKKHYRKTVTEGKRS